MPPLTPARVAEQAAMLANRVARKFRHLRPKMERADIGAYRLYDRDIPEVRAVVDWYEGHLVVGEYARAQTDMVDDWVGSMARAVAAALGVPEAHVHVRSRQTRPERGERYERLDAQGERLVVREGALRFYVNLDDYLDTGLFTDHRVTRAMVTAEAAGKRVLNLFGYTGSFTCAAAKGGAASTTTVDLSGRYLDWTRDNLALNGLASPAHVTRREDAVWFLRDEARAGRRYDLAVLDPPSFSTKGGVDGLDVQRDHRGLVEATLELLAPGGSMLFSTNHQRFEPRLDGLNAREITAQTLPEDYRGRSPHRCWRVAR